jgi:phosphoserine phosphatase
MTTPPAAADTRQQVRDLELILGVARALAATSDLNALLALILNAVRLVLNAERGTLFLYDPLTDELYSKIAHGAGEIRCAATSGIVGAVAQTRQAINIPDAYADPRFNPEVDRQTGYRTRCLLSLPLIGLEEQLVGVLQLLNKVGGVFDTYDEHLAGALAAQAGVALQRARLMEHYVQKKQMEKALAVAREIQQRLLPKTAPALRGYEIAGSCRPTDQTGGDCFDYISLPNGRLAVVVADAAGHGVGAALLITEARAWLRALAAQTEVPAQVLSHANRWLCAESLEGRFVTAFYGILDPLQHTMEYASAGHGPLFWYHADRNEVTYTGATGLPLGMMALMDVRAAPTVAFGPGDLGVFLTDGYIEAHGPDGEQFGSSRLTEVLKANAKRPVAEIIQELTLAVERFMAGGPQLDDRTAVIVKRC